MLSATNGAAAIDILDSGDDIDLLFTDVVMPGGLNGRQLADEAVRRRPGLKVLFTTGYTRNAIVHHGRLDPGVEMIGKPFSIDELTRKVRAILDGSAAPLRREGTSAGARIRLRQSANRRTTDSAKPAVRRLPAR